MDACWNNAFFDTLKRCDVLKSWFRPWEKELRGQWWLRRAPRTWRCSSDPSCCSRLWCTWRWVGLFGKASKREDAPHLVYHTADTVNFGVFMDLSALDIFNAASTGPSDQLHALHLAVKPRCKTPNCFCLTCRPWIWVQIGKIKDWLVATFALDLEK